MKMLRAILAGLAILALGAPVDARAASCSTLGAGPATWSGNVNTYYPGSGTAGAGSQSISIGSATGAGNAIAVGDLLLVVQMQDASIDSSNSGSYGGSGGGSGYTGLGSSGLFEYAVAASAVGTGGGSVSLAAPLLNTYRTAGANAAGGQKTFQVVRVPQASSATISGDLTAPGWDGATGGIIAIDVAGNLNWAGRTLEVSGRGFRGGGGQCSITSGGGWLDTDHRTPLVTLSTTGTGTTPNGAKGEGVAGTPIVVFTPTTVNDNSAGVRTVTSGTDGTTGGYPNGSFGRGAPGNGGGGGTDGNPTANDQNTGGAGGGNYGIGGKGGYGWTPGTPPGDDAGGFGGMSMPSGATRLFFGGGGGAGSTNNCTGTPANGVASSGAAGGGLVFVRAGTTSGSASINARGTDANSTITNDASGGGGAGGSVLVFVNNGGGAIGASINIQGGNGGSNTGGGSPHGPGGGGSGGFAIISGTASVNAAGGTNGTTATSPTSTIEYGSSPSVGGFQIVNLGAADIPGAGSATQCFPRLTVTKSTSTPTASVGAPVTWTFVVSNLTGRSAATGVTIGDALANANITYASTSSVVLGGGATRPTTTNPTAGSNTPAWSLFTIPGGGSVTLTFLANTLAALPPGTYQNPATVTYDDPTRTTAGQVVTPGGAYIAGAALGTVPGSNYNPASSTAEDVTFVAPPAFTKTFAPTAITVGAPSVLTVTLSNPGATALTAVGFTDSYPAGLVNTAAPSGSSSCGGTVTAAPGGTGFTLAGAGIAAGGSCTVTVNVTMTSPGPYTNTIPAGALTDAQGITNTQPASATLYTNLRVVKSFVENAVAPGTDSQLHLVIQNDNTAAMTLANPGLTDTFPAGLVATAGAITVSGAGCTGFAPAAIAANATAIVFTAGTIPAASSCDIRFAVHSATTGIYANTSSGVTTTQTGSTTGPPSNTASLGVGVINIAKAFAQPTILAGGTSMVTLTLTNPTGVAQTGANFTDTLTNMAVSGNQNTGGTCAPAVALTNLQTALSFTGLNIPGGGPPATCTITFLVTSSTVGSQTNTAGGVATALLPRGPASNTATLNVLSKPAIAKAFVPSTIPAAGTSTLTFTLTNAGALPLSGMAFTDSYPANVVNATPLTVGGTCTSVTTTAAAGGGTFNVTAGNIPASSSCTITVAVTSSLPGAYNNTASGVATTQTGTAGTGSNTATLNVASTPTITKAFGTSPIAQGGTSVITFTVNNPNTGLALTNLRFTDALTNMSVSTPTLGGDCGASNSPTLAAGATALDITIPSLAAGASCTVTVSVTSSVSGSWPNTTSGVTSTQTTMPGAPSGTVTLVVLSPPALTKGFSPSIIQTGGTSVMTFTLSNPNASTALGNVLFTDTLSNMSVGSATIGGTCGAVQLDGAGTPTALVVGDTVLRLRTTTLAGGASCTITISVTSGIVSPAGGHPNTTSAVTSTQTPTTGGTAASASLTVLAAPTITKSFSPSSVAGAAVSTITFTLTNPNAITLTNVRFSDTFPTVPGVMRTPASAQVYTGAGRGTCAGTIPNAQGATSVATLSFAAITMPANSSCTIMVDVEMLANGTYTNTTSGVISNQTPVAGATATGVVSRGRIGITKSFLPATIQSGGTSTVSFALLNNTGGAVNDIQLTDTFPAGMVATGGAVTVTGGCTGLTPATLVANATSYTITDLDGLASAGTCTISFSVTGTTAGVKSNTVSGTSPAAINGVSSSANLTVFAAPTILKSFSPATIAAGGTTTLTFTLANPNSFAALSGAAFTDTLTNMSVSGAQTVGGSCIGTTPSTLADGATALAFSGIGLPPSASCTVTVVVTSTVAGTRPNTVSGVTTTQTPTAGTGNGPVNLTVSGINLTKSYAPASRPVGVPTTLTFLLASPSAVAWTGLGFTDTLPANLVVATPSNATTTCPSGTVTATPGTNVITLSGGTMAAGASPCAVNVDVVSSVSGTYNNAAGNFSALSPGVTYTGGTVPVTFFAASTVTKAFSPASIASGGTSTLTFTITNPLGAQAVAGLGFTDTLPPGVSVVAAPAPTNTCGGTWAPAAGSTAVTLTGALRPAGLSSCTLSVAVTATTLGAYTNGTSNFSGLAGGLTANTANATLNVVGTALTKAFNAANIGSGGVSTLTFTITNGTGNPAQSGLAFTETLPTNVFVAGAPAVVNGCGGTVTATASTSTIQLAGGSIAAAVASCTLSVNVTSAIVGSYFNGPSNISGQSPTMDTGGVNATLGVAETPVVTKGFSPQAVGLNTNSQLTITLTNANAFALTGAAFTDTYPLNVVNAPQPPNPATTCGGTVTAAAGTGTVALSGGTIPANSFCTVTVNVRSATAGSYTNTLPIGAVSTANAGVNSTPASAVLNVLAPITVGKAYSLNPAVAGTNVTLTITLTNPNAFAAATGVAFTDTNPVGVLNKTSVTPGATTCGAGVVTAADNGTSVALANGTIGAGTSCTVTVQQSAAAAGAYTNIIPIGDVTTTNAGSNAAAASTTLNNYVAPTLTKAFGASIGPGGSTTLTFTITNPAANPAAVSGIGFTDVFPTTPGAMTYVSTASNACAATLADSGGGALANGDVGVQATGISLAPGASCTIVVNVTAPVIGSYSNTTGAISSTTPVLTGATATASLTVAQASLTKAFTPASVTVGGTPATLVFTLTNAAGNPAQAGINFTDTLPVGLAVAGTPNFQSNCPAGGALVNNPGFLTTPGGVITVTGAAINAAVASCEIRVNVVPSATPTAGACVANNTNGSTNIGGLARVTNSVTNQCLAVTAATPTLDKAFSGPIVAGTTGTGVLLTFTISQPANNPVQTFSFTDTLPAGLTVDTGLVGGSCAGGSVTITAGNPAIVVAGRQVTGASCTITVPVRASSTPTAGVCPVANNTNGNTQISAITNITAAIANSAAGGGTSTGGACVAVTARPTVAKSYTLANPVVAGANTTLTITLSNSNAIALTGAAFTDTNPVGVLNKTSVTPGTTTCGAGVVTAADNGTSVALSGGTIPAGGSCTVTVLQSAAAAGTYNNVIAIGDVTTANGGSNAVAANATLNAYAALTFSKAFGGPIGPGGSTTLTFTITNPAANPAAVSGISFTDVFPTTPGAMTYVSTASNACVATLADSGGGALASGDVGIQASGVSLAPGASCTIVVNVTAPAVGTYNNTTGAIASTTPAFTGTTASASLTVAQPTLTKAFTPTSVTVGGTPSTLVFTLTNAAGNPAQMGINFTDTLPMGLAVAGTPNFQSNCPAGGALVNNPGFLTAPGGVITVTGAAINAAIGSCEIRVDVAPSSTATAGACAANNTNGSGNIGGLARVTNNVTNQCLAVTAATPLLNKAFSAAIPAGGTGTGVILTFTISQPANNPAQTFSFTDTLPAGLTVDTGLVGGTCTGGSVTITAGNPAIVVAGRQVSGASCTITVPVRASATPTAGVCPQPNNTNAGGNISGMTNITAAIANSAAGAGSSTSGACVTVYAPPTLTKAFGASIGPGGSTTLTFTVGNPAANGTTASGISFTDVFPTTPGAMTYVSTASNACAATLADSGGGALANGDVGVQATGISLASGASCTIVVNVSAPTAGSYSNTTGAITATAPAALTGTAANATLIVAQPTLTKAFTPASVTIGGTPATLVFTLTNAAGNPAQAGINFADTLPVGLAVAGTPNFQSNCPAGGALVNNPGFLTAPGGVITVTGAAINAAVASCEIRVNVVPSATPTAGACVANNTNGSTNIGGIARVTNSVTNQCLAVTAATPTLDKAFSGPIVAGTTGTGVLLTFTISQPANNPVQTFSFTDTLPAGLTVDTGLVGGSCAGGSVTITAGNPAIVVAGRQVTGASCTITVPVRASSTPTAGVCPVANNTNGNTQISAITNITAAIANSAAGGGTSTGGACVAVTARPTITKFFTPNPAATGQASTLTIRLTNPNAATAVTGAAFTDTYPAGLTNTATPGGSGCGGTVTAAGNGTSVALSGGTIPAGGFCDVTVQVNATAAGSYANTIPAGAVTTANAGSNAAAASATLDVLAAPAISKAFGGTIGPGGTTTLTFTITNPASNTQALTGVAFTDTFPTSPGAMTVASAGAPPTGCGAPTFTPVAGAGSISFSGGAVAVGGTCIVTVNVTAPAAGTYNNVSGALTATGPVALTGNTASASLTVAQASLTKAFTPASVTVGGTPATLVFTLTNAAGNPAQAGINFADTLPVGLAVAGTPNFQSNCPAGGALVNNPAFLTTPGGVITVTGAAINAAVASCEIRVNVVPSATPTAGACVANNTNGSTNIGGIARVTNSVTNQCLAVTAATPTLDKAFSGPIVAGTTGTGVLLTFTISQPANNPVQTFSFTDTLPAGLTVDTGLVGGSCAGGSVTITAGNPAIVVAGRQVTGASCTITVPVRASSTPTAGVCPVANNTNGNTQISAITNITAAIANSAAGGGTSTGGACATVYAPSTFAKAFSPATIGPGGTTLLTFTITNPNPATALTGVAFNDVFPTSPGAMVVASAGPPPAGCGTPTFVPVAGAASVAFSGGTIAAGGTCTASVNVTAPAVGAYNNTSGAVTATGPVAITGPTASNSLTVAQAALTKAFAPAIIDQDGISTLVFTIANAATNPAQAGISFIDTLPAGLAVAAAPGVQSNCPAGGALVNNPAFVTATAGSGAIAVSNAAMTTGVASCEVRVNVTTPTAGTYANTDAGNITGASRVTTTGVNATLTVQAIASLTKAFGAATVPLGGTTTLTFTINNTAPSAVNRTGVSLTDTLPAGISIANPAAPTTNGNCGTPAFIAANNTQPFTASAVSVNAGQTCTITLTVRGVTAGTVINGAANVTTTGIGNGVTNQSLTVVGAPTVAKAFTPAAITADGTSTITFTISNPNAAVALTGAGFTDTLSAMAVNAAGPAAGDCAGAASNVFAAGATALTFTGLTIPAAGSCFVSVVVSSDIPGPHNNVTSGVTSTEGPTGPPSNTATLTVTAATPTIAKAFAPPSIALGGSSTITFTLANTNGVALTGAGFTDALTNMSVGASGATAGGTCSGAASNSFAAFATNLAFSGLTVPANGSCTVTVAVTSTVPGTHNNQASGVSSNEAATGAASNTAALTVSATPPTISKAFTSAISSGGSTTLTITINNPNAAAITVLGVTDTFPTTPGAGLARASTPNPGTTCVGGTVSSTAGSVTLTGGVVPANSFCTFQIEVTAATTGSYVNTIPAGALTTTAGSNAAAASATLSVNPQANLSINKAAPVSIATGSAITYTITVTNLGPDAANNASFSDNVPPAVTGVGASCAGTAGAVCAAPAVAGNAVTGTIGTLPAGGVATYTITGTTTGAAAISNTATIAAPPGVTDPAPGNNSSTAGTTVLAPDLTITKGHAGNFTAGTNGTYSIAVTNAGTAATVGTITVSDALPSGLGFVSGTGTGWTCGFAAGIVTCTSSAAIAAGATAPAITLVVTVGTTAIPSVNNVVSVGGGGEPPALANNNIGSDNTLVVAAGSNTLAPSNAQTALPGTVLFYPHIFTAGGTGSVAFTTAAAITPATPGWTQLIYRDGNCNGVLDGAEGSAFPLTTAVPVNAGDTVCIVVKDSIPANAPYNSLANITVTATFNGTETYVVHDVTTVGAAGGAGLTLAKSVRNVTQGTAATTSGSARPDDVLEYTITYTNSSYGPLTSIVVTDATPAFTTFVSAACPAPPPSLTACTVTSSPAVGSTGSVVWTLAGSLLANGVGSVTYQVRVAP